MWISVLFWYRWHMPLTVMEIDGIRMDRHIIPYLGEWRHMFNFLLMQSGSSGSLSSVQIMITIGKRQPCLIHAGLSSIPLELLSIMLQW